MHGDNRDNENQTTISDQLPYQFPGKLRKSDRCNDHDETAWCQSGALESTSFDGRAKRAPTKEGINA